MTTPPTPLPKFSKPPVVETLMGVYFKLLPEFHVAARATFWEQHAAQQFPELREIDPIDEVIETFGEDGWQRPQPRWKIATGMPSPRLWAKSTDGRHTIQVQHNALLVNWERNPEQPEYLPYTDRRQGFQEKLESLDRFVAQRNIGSLQIKGCFITYINHIDYPDKVGYASKLDELLTLWRNDTSDPWLPPAEQATLQASFAMPNKQGRLHVKVSPAMTRQTKQRFIRFDLTARGTPVNESLPAALDWLDLGHEWIVRGFASLTRPEMHQQWGRTQ